MWNQLCVFEQRTHCIVNDYIHLLLKVGLKIVPGLPLIMDQLNKMDNNVSAMEKTINVDQR
jgi:hypothetical protein